MQNKATGESWVEIHEHPKGLNQEHTNTAAAVDYYSDEWREANLLVSGHMKYLELVSRHDIFAAANSSANQFRTKVREGEELRAYQVIGL